MRRNEVTPSSQPNDPVAARKELEDANCRHLHALNVMDFEKLPAFIERSVMLMNLSRSGDMNENPMDIFHEFEIALLFVAKFLHTLITEDETDITRYQNIISSFDRMPLEGSLLRLFPGVSNGMLWIEIPNWKEAPYLHQLILNYVNMDLFVQQLNAMTSLEYKKFDTTQAAQLFISICDGIIMLRKKISKVYGPALAKPITAKDNHLLFFISMCYRDIHLYGEKSFFLKDKIKALPALFLGKPNIQHETIKLLEDLHFVLGTVYTGILRGLNFPGKIEIEPTEACMADLQLDYFNYAAAVELMPAEAEGAVLPDHINVRMIIGYRLSFLVHALSYQLTRLRAGKFLETPFCIPYTELLCVKDAKSEPVSEIECSIDYTTNSNRALKKYASLWDNLLHKRNRLLGPEDTNFIKYLIDKDESAVLDMPLFRKTVLDTKLIQNFVNTDLIEERNNHLPMERRLNSLIDVSVFFMNLCHKLCDGIIETKQHLPLAKGQVVNFDIAANTDPSQPRFSILFEEMSQESKISRFILESYLKMPAINRYINVLMGVACGPDTLTKIIELTRFYIEAVNLNLQMVNILASRGIVVHTPLVYHNMDEINKSLTSSQHRWGNRSILDLTRAARFGQRSLTLANIIAQHGGARSFSEEKPSSLTTTTLLQDCLPDAEKDISGVLKELPDFFNVEKLKANFVMRGQEERFVYLQQLGFTLLFVIKILIKDLPEFPAKFNQLICESAMKVAIDGALDLSGGKDTLVIRFTPAENLSQKFIVTSILQMDFFVYALHNIQYGSNKQNQTVFNNLLRTLFNTVESVSKKLGNFTAKKELPLTSHRLALFYLSENDAIQYSGELLSSKKLFDELLNLTDESADDIAKGLQHLIDIHHILTMLLAHLQEPPLVQGQMLIKGPANYAILQRFFEEQGVAKIIEVVLNQASSGKIFDVIQQTERVQNLVERVSYQISRLKQLLPVEQVPSILPDLNQLAPEEKPLHPKKQGKQIAAAVTPRTPYRAIINNVLNLPGYFNKEIITAKICQLASAEMELKLYLELEIAAVFVMRFIHTNDFTQQPLPPTMQKAFARCKLTAKKCGTESNVYENLYAHNETAPLEYHYVSTYLHLDKLYNLIPKENNTIVRTQIEIHFQNLIGQALAASTIFHRKISILYQYYQPNYNNHFNLLETMLQDDILKNPNAILLNVEMINENISDSSQEDPESRLRLLQILITRLRLAVKQVIYVPLAKIIDNQGNRLLPGEGETDNSEMHELLNINKINLVMNIILSLPDKMKVVKACLTLSTRVRDIIDFLYYQDIHLQNNLPAEQLSLPALDELNIQPAQPASVLTLDDTLISYTTVDKKVIDLTQATWKKLIIEKNSRPAANASDKKIQYLTTADEDAFFDPKVFQSSLMRTKVVSQFLRGQAITNNPVATREHLQKTFLAAVYLMKFFNNLSGGICEKSAGPTIGIMNTDTTENALGQYNGKSDDIIKTVALHEFIHNYKPTRQDMILRLIDLTTFYLEAYNLAQQLSLLLEPHKTTFYYKLTFIPLLELTNNIIRATKNGIPAQPERTLEQMLADKDKPVTIITPPSSISVVTTTPARSEEHTSRIKASLTSPLKESPRKTQDEKQIAETKTSERNEKQFHVTDDKSTPAKKTTDKPRQSEAAPIIVEPAQIRKELSARLKQQFEDLKIQLYANEVAIKELREEFRKRFREQSLRQREDVRLLETDIFEEIPSVWRGVRNDLNEWLVDEENHETSRKQLSVIAMKLSDLRLSTQAAKPRVAQLTFIIDKEAKTRKPVEEDKPRPQPVKKRIPLTPPRSAAAPKTATPSPKPFSISSSATASPSKLYKPAPLAKSEFEEAAPLRIRHLNEACKNLILIRKTLEGHEQTLINNDVAHFALLYNIFRCFQSLKGYQACGGRKQTLDEDMVIDLRNMLIHYGAHQADSKEVISFARKMQGSLPTTLLELKAEQIVRHEVTQEMRQEIINEFQISGEPGLNIFRNHATLVISTSKLYHSLAAFHESKTENKIKWEDYAIIESYYLPLIREISDPLFNKHWHEPQFVEVFWFELQALRMLVTICGELGAAYMKSSPLKRFLEYCHTDIRNKVGHVLNDMEPDDMYIFAASLRKQLNTKQARNSGPFFSPRLTSQPAPTSTATSATSVPLQKHGKK